MNPQDFAKKYPGSLQPIGAGAVAYVANPLPPKKCEITGAVWKEYDEALISLGELRAVVPYLPNPTLFTSPFLRREAVLSSRIEGTNTEIQQLYLFEAEESVAKPTKRMQPPTESQSDAREVLNYVRALEYGLKKLAELPICTRMLCDMHELLMWQIAPHRGLNKQPGEFRRNQAYIGSRDIRAARYVAAPADKLVSLMKDLESFINVSNSDLPVLVRIAMTHYQFEAIHPFADGNGRLGRLLISLQLAAHGILPEPLLYLSAFFESHRREYNTRLWEVSRAGAWIDWLLFFFKGVHAVADDAVQRAHKLLKLRDDFRAKLETSAVAMKLVDKLFSTPVITVNEAKEITKFTYRGAKQNIQKLVDVGLLVAPKGRQRNKAYYAKPILDMLGD